MQNKQAREQFMFRAINIYLRNNYSTYLLIKMCENRPTTIRIPPIASPVFVVESFIVININSIAPMKIRMIPMFLSKAFILFRFCILKLKTVKDINSVSKRNDFSQISVEYGRFYTISFLIRSICFCLFTSLRLFAVLVKYWCDDINFTCSLFHSFISPILSCALSSS